MEPRIVITFKLHEKDMYNYLKQFSSPAAHVKDLILREMRERDEARRKHT